jgi:acyl-CoA thioester hydrolase
MPERAPPPRLADFAHRTSDSIRFGDLDSQGHVNNSVIATYFESGRVAITREQGFMVPDAGFSLARLTIDFLRELNWPGRVEIGTRVKRLGRTSLVFDQAVFLGETCVAVAEATMVLVDRATRRPRPFPDDVAERLRAAAAG